MPFSPSDISGLKIWLKADAGAGSSDGDPVGTWSDQSGGSHNFTAAGSARPTYKVNIRNGLPCVLFDGSDDELDGGNLSSLFSTGASVFAVADQISGSSWTMYEHGQIDAWWSFSGAGYWGPFRSSRLSGTPGSGLPTSGWHYWSMTADNGSNYKMWLDGSNQINDTGGFTFQGGTQHRIGRQHPNGNYMNMYLAELIIYDSALNDTDRQSVESYLADRWINLKASPSVVAGVGAVPSSTTTGTGTATPSAVAGVGAVPAPNVFATAAGTANPAATEGVGAVPSAAATGAARGLPSATAGTATVPAGTETGLARTTPNVVGGTGLVLAPSAFGQVNATAHPSKVSGVGAVPHPTAVGASTGGGGGSVDGVTDFWTLKGVS